MVEFSPYAYAFHEDPFPIYARLREEAPVHHNRELDFWALSHHADVLAAFKDVETFSNSHGVSIDPTARGPHARAVTSFIATDPPEHTRFRARVARGFTPRRVAALEPQIREIAARRLDRLEGRAEFDFIAEFAGKLPMDVISEMLGVPEADRSELRIWADAMVHREEGIFDVPPEGARGYLNIRRYFEALLPERREQPGDDLLSALLTMRGEDGGPLFDDEALLPFCNLMITAGNETTTKLLGNMLYWLWRNPETMERVAADPGRIPDWTEETLRYDNSTQALMRLTTREVTIRGVKIPAGQYVLLLIGSANRDPAVFPEPDAYDIDRDTSQSLAFGRGNHFCMGAALARLEARVAFEEWWKRFPRYEIQTDGIERVHSVNVRGFAALPVKR